MELSILLIQQICQLFIMIFFGFLLVRGRVLTAENSKVLSILLLYVACPCAIINSFMIDFTSDKLIGLGLDEFSMSATSILAQRKLIKSVSKADMEALVEKALDCATSEEVVELVKSTVKM